MSLVIKVDNDWRRRAASSCNASRLPHFLVPLLVHLAFLVWCCVFGTANCLLSASKRTSNFRISYHITQIYRLNVGLRELKGYDADNLWWPGRNNRLRSVIESSDLYSGGAWPSNMAAQLLIRTVSREHRRPFSRASSQRLTQHRHHWLDDCRSCRLHNHPLVSLPRKLRATTLLYTLQTANYS